MGNIEQKTKINIALSKIQEVSYQFNTEFDISSLTPRSLSFGMKYETKTNKEEEKVRITTSVIYLSTDSKETLAEYAIMIEFHVKGLTELITIDSNDKELINRDLILNLLNISIGTLRGAFFLKTKGTAFEHFPIPLIPSNILEDEVKEVEIKE